MWLERRSLARSRGEGVVIEKSGSKGLVVRAGCERTPEDVVGERKYRDESQKKGRGKKGGGELQWEAHL